MGSTNGSRSSLRQTNEDRCLRLCQIPHMALPVGSNRSEWTRSSRFLSAVNRPVWPRLSKLWVLLANVTKVLQPGADPFDPGCFGWCLLGGKSVDHTSTHAAFLVRYNMELSITSAKREVEICPSSNASSAHWLVGTLLHLGIFSSLASAAWQLGGVGPFFSPSRQQYHSSDLSPSPRLNVWKQDVLRLLALLGEAGMLIPRPRGARQYGTAWWPPASPGSRCHNTSCIASNQCRLPIPTHLHHCGRMSDSSSKQSLPRVLRAGWQQKLSFCCRQTTSYFLIKSVAAMLDRKGVAQAN